MTQNIDSDIAGRVRETLARVFKLPASEAGDLRMGHHPLWNSMGHMQLIVELEKEFELRFPTYEIAELLSTETITKAVERYGQK
jgi:acyl carrier protein